jgi:hypothetical protein
MAFVKGMKRPVKSGRKKGTPNKATQDFKALLRDNNFSPGQALIDCYNAAIELYDKRHKHKNFMAAVDALKLAAKTADSIAQYTYPRLKAIEHSGEIGVRTFSDFIKAGLQPDEIDVTPKLPAAEDD